MWHFVFSGLGVREPQLISVLKFYFRLMLTSHKRR